MGKGVCWDPGAASEMKGAFPSHLSHGVHKMGTEMKTKEELQQRDEVIKIVETCIIIHLALKA